MSPIATDGVASSVCLSVCLSVGHVSEPCKNGWTNPGADWSIDTGAPNRPRNYVLDCAPDPKGEGAIVGFCLVYWKALRVFAVVYALKINNDISVTVAAYCIAPDWPMSY